MTQVHWPTVDRPRPQNALDHAASLEADFEALDAAVELNTSKHHRLPSSLRKDITRAVSKALSDNEYPYELSKADQDLIGALILKHITTEATERARDRIPLRQYHDLRRSFQELVPKLRPHGSRPDPDPMTRTNEREANNFVEPAPVEPFGDIRDSVSRAGEETQLAVRSKGDDTYEEAGQGAFFRSNQVSPELGEVTVRPKKKGRKRKIQSAVGSNGNDTHEEIGQQNFFHNKQISPEIDESTVRSKKKGRKRKEHDRFKETVGEGRAKAVRDHNDTPEIMGTEGGVEEVGVHKDGVHSEVEADDPDDHESLLRMFRDIEAQCENIRLQVQDFEDGQLEESTILDAADELMENQSMVETHVVKTDNADTQLVEEDTLVNGPSDQAQSPNDQAAIQTQGDHGEQFQHAREVAEVTGLDAYSIITFNIKHQATVNHLYVMGSVGILQSLLSSLETMRSKGHDPPRAIRFTNGVLLEDGNVEVQAHADSKEDMERLSRVRGWDLEFEKSISMPAKSYAIELANLNVDVIDMQTRKHKAAAIEELLEKNSRSMASLRGVGDIQDIRWCKELKDYTMQSNLIIEFRTAQQANETLDVGVFVRDKHYTCQSVDKKFLRCGRCQAFDHHEGSCSSAPRCGKCASQHITSACTSHIRQCANCYGPHQTSDKRCPAVKAYKQTLRYTDHSAPVGEIQHQEPALHLQSQTTNLRLPSSNPMPITSHHESEIKVEENESLANLGSSREHHRGGPAAPHHPSMPVNVQNGPHVRTEGSEPSQGIGIAQNNPPDLTLLRRELEDLRMMVGRLAAPQHQPWPRKRGADAMPPSGPSSYARKKPKYGTQGRYSDPIPNRGHVPADRGIPTYAVASPGQRMPRQGYTRRL